MAAALDDLRALLGDRCSTSTSVLGIHGRDESAHPEAAPDAVVFPSSTGEVAEIVRICAAAGTPIIPFGAGTSLEGHVLATRGGVCMDLSGMDRIIDVSSADLDARVQPGVHRVALNEHLGRQGLFFSVDPGADATIGGMAATGAAGTTTVRYGTMRDNVIALEVVLADGSVIRTGTRARKSVAGYDLTRLFVGSEGTIGVITEITVRVFGIPERIAAAVCSFPSVHVAVDTAIGIVQLGIPIARCELLDANGMRAANAFSGLSEPEQPTLFMEFHGTEASVSEDAQAAGEIAKANGGGDFRWSISQEERSRLWSARHDLHYAARALRPGATSIVTDVAVPVSRLAECIDQTLVDVEQLPFPAVVIGHVADGNFHTSLVLMGHDEAERAAAAVFVERLTARAHALDGTCTGEHGIGIGKRRALAAELGDAVGTMRALKHALDPGNIMNPGKIFEE